MNTQKFLDLASHYSTWSKDPNTKVGAVAIDDHKRQKSMGFNGFPSKFPDTEENWQRPNKYNYIVHAEANMVCSAAREVLYGTTVYVTHLCCGECAKLMVQAGVKKVVTQGTKLNGNHYDLEHAYQILRSCGVEYEVINND